MAAAALAFIIAWLVIVAGVRGYLHMRRTGSLALSSRDRRGSPQWWSRRISLLGVLFALAAPIAELAGLAPIGLLDDDRFRLAGAVIFWLGIAVTVASQVAMGASWRGDVDPEIRTELVTTGPFRLVRNPILSGTALTAIGLALMVPNVLAVAMLVAFAVGMNVQVRLVEEPYLRRVHGDAYARYAARTGRFLPWIGRLRRNEPQDVA